MLNEKKILDITERIRAKQISKFKQYSIDHATESIYWVKPDASFFYVNETACNTLGYTYDELLNMTVHDINPDYKKESWETVWTKIKKLGSYTFETQHKTKDGTVFPVEITANHVKHEGWEYNCAFVRDISDRRQAEEILYKKKRALNVISQFNHALVHAANEQQLLDDICRIIVYTGNYKLAWIGYAENDNNKTVRPVAQSGYEEGYIDTLNVTWADTPHGRGPAGTSIRKQEPYVARNILTDDNFKPWRDAALQRGYASATGIPLVIAGETVGALIIYAPEADAFDTEEMELLTELADNLAFGIHTLRIEAERKQTETALRNQNAVLTSLSRSTELARYDFANFIKLLTRVAGRMLKVERTSVWLFNEDRSLLCCFDLYELSKDKHNDDKVRLEAASYPNYFAALREGRAIAADNAHKNPATCEFSETYLAPYGISSMLDAPIRNGGEIVGVVCHEHVGTSRQWTLEEQDFAGSIADFASLAFATREHKQLKKELKYHKQFKHYWSFEKLVAKLSTNFINLTLDQLDQGITESLKAIGHFANVDRCYVFDFSSDQSRVKNVYEWCDEFFINNKQQLPQLNIDEYSWIISESLKGEFVNIPVVKEIKVNTTWQQRVIKHNSIQSLLALPLLLGNKVIGLLGLESVRTYRSWSKKEITRFRIASDMFAHTLGRKLADETHSYTNRALNVLSQCNDALMHATHEQDLLEEVCQIIVDSGNYKFAWIGFNQEKGDLTEQYTTIYPVAQAGYKDFGLDIMESTWLDVNTTPGAIIAAIKTGEPYINHDLVAGEHYTTWNEYAISHGCKSSVTLPLVSEKETLGVLIIYASEQDAFSETEIDLLIKLSSNLVYGIQSLRTRVEQLKTQVFSVIEKETNNIIGLNLALNEQLALFNKTIEANFPGSCCSVLLLDKKKKHLYYGSANSLPDAFKFILDGLRIGKSATTCGNTAYNDSLVISADIKSDPDWSRYNKIISKYSIQACWSHPIHAPDGLLLGTFAFYFTSRKSPTNEDLFLLEFLAGLAGKIIDHKQTKDEISKSDMRFQTLYNDSPMILFNIDINGKILSINTYGSQQLGYLTSELIGESINEILFEEDHKLMRAHIQKCFTEQDNVHQWEFRKKKKNGNVIWGRETARIINESKNDHSLFIMCENVTETHILSEKLSHQQKHDSLTGLLNRKEFERQLETKIQESCINKTDHALCYLDLDQFKVINDTCGHIAGDELIRQLSNKMQSRIRKKDTFARLGGDEFGVLIESCTLEQAMRVANELSEAIRAFDFVWKEKRFTLGVSIGLVPINDTSGDVISIMSAADEACYVAKEAGRNRIHVYHPDDADLSKLRGEMQWVSQITHALEEDRLVLNKQTIIPINDQGDQGDHYEVLVRMKDENGNNIPPATFLPSAERYNLSGKLDIWVVKTAFSWLETSRVRLANLKLCSINLSCLSLVDDEVLVFILDKFNEGIISPEKICFEITETAAISNLTSATIFINTLKDLGCMFALDDFGSGLSSFAYLRNLPVDFLKIDGRFVRNIANNPIDFAMVRSINEIGKVMGKQTIAEYVEDDEILDQLRIIGVDYAQGFRIGKPKPLY